VGDAPRAGRALGAPCHGWSIEPRLKPVSGSRDSTRNLRRPPADNQGMTKASAKSKTAAPGYACACGYRSSQRFGRCPRCGEWGSLQPHEAGPGGASTVEPRPLCEVGAEPAPRLRTGIGELDRVLGGGLVPGSLVLLGGEPGIGKSTLLLQGLAGLVRRGGSALYVSGEESLEQIALRARRLRVHEARLLALAETRLEAILAAAERSRPAVVAVDSVQTLQADGGGAPGSPALVREASAALGAQAKAAGVPLVLVGHVTKEGGLAGPKTLEHLVDAVLTFEGEPSSGRRLLRATKNRFGSTNELGVFEMRGAGLCEVENPSALFLAERAAGVAGSAVVACLEGSRPLLVEVQALTAPASGVPRRAVVGLDPYRVALLLAVCARRAGVDALGHDVFVNVAGGVRLSEPAADLGLVAALASSASGRPVRQGTICFGEVGLGGEVRAAGAVDRRLAEAAKLGFSRCVLPEASRRQARRPDAPGLLGVRDVRAALAALLE